MKHGVRILQSVQLNGFYIGASTKVVQRLSFHQNAEEIKFISPSVYLDAILKQDM